MRFSPLFLVVFVCFYQCNSPSNSASTNTNLPLDSLLIGEWESVQLNILVNSFQQQPDSSFRINVEPGEWTAKLGLNKSVTTFNSDHKFTRIDFDVAQNIKAEGKGIWNLFGDTTLLFIERDATYRYDISYTKDRIVLESLLDWDGDGEADDEYFMALERL